MKKVEVFEGEELHKAADYLDHSNEHRDNANTYQLHGNSTHNGNQIWQLDNEVLSKHIMMIGGIGTGKTNTFYHIISEIKKKMTKSDVMIIFDAKGDYLKEFKTNNDDYIVIGNDTYTGKQKNVDYWNIFNEIEEGEQMESYITEIANALFQEHRENSNNVFFPNAAKDLFAAILTHYMKSGEPCDNEVLRDFLDRSDAEAIRQILKQHPDMRAMISYISESKSPQTQGVLSELQQVAREVLIGNFRKKGTLSMRQLVRKKDAQIIFIEYDLGIGSMLAPIYKLLFDLAMREALGRRKSEGNVYFIADEFRLMSRLEHLDNAVNFGRSLGVKYLIGIQNVDQVFDVYGEYKAKSILSGFTTKVVFNVGDGSTGGYVQELFGKNRKKDIYKSVVGSRGIIEEVREANVVEDWDIAALETGQAIISTPGYEPFVFHFDEYKSGN